MNSTDTSFGYIQLGDDFFYIKDMYLPEVAKFVLSIKVGELLHIRNLGVLKLTRIFFCPHKDVDSTINEIGLICSRVDA